MKSSKNSKSPLKLMFGCISMSESESEFTSIASSVGGAAATTARAVGAGLLGTGNIFAGLTAGGERSGNVVLSDGRADAAEGWGLARGGTARPPVFALQEFMRMRTQSMHQYKANAATLPMSCGQALTSH